MKNKFIINRVMNKELTKLKILNGYAILYTNKPNNPNPIILKYEILTGILQSLPIYKLNKQTDIAR